MYCDKCGAEIADGMKFCSSCGAKVGAEQASVESEKSVAGEQPVIRPLTSEAEMNGNAEKEKGALEKVGKLVTKTLSVISVIMLIGAFFGVFDKDPIPFLIFIGVILVANKLEEKFPKMPAIALAAFEVIALVVCFNIAGNAGAVAAVKTGKPTAYPTISYERAFSDYFSSPTWKSAGKDEDGNEVVKFVGNCQYLGSEAVAEIKFTVYEEQGSFVASSVKLNGQDMGLLGNALILDVFEEYEQNH